MGFQVSPGVEVKEIDLTNVIPAVSTSIGGFSGYFKWGPIGEISLLSSEKALLQKFGTPDSSVLYADPFFQAASFLEYGEAIKVVRAGNSTNFSNATDNGGADAFEVSSITTGDLPDGSYSGRTVGTANDFAFTVTSGEPTIVTNVSLADQPISGALVIADSDSTSLDTLTISTTLPTGTVYRNVGDFTFDRTIDDKVVSFSLNASTGTISIVENAVSGVALADQIASFTFSAPVTVTDENASPVISETFVDVSVDVAYVQDSYTVQLTFDGISDNGVYIPNETYFEDTTFNTDGGTFAAKYPGVAGNGLKVYALGETSFDSIKDDINASPSEATGEETAVYNSFDLAPDAGEIHVAVVDVAGNFGVPGSVIEKFAGLSISKTAKTDAGATNYIKNVINTRSRYIYLIKGDTDDYSESTFAGTSAGEFTLSGGTEASALLPRDIKDGLDLLADTETVDVNLIFSQIEATGAVLQNHVHKIAYERKDAVAFLSPPKAATVGSTTPLADVIEFNDAITNRGVEGSYGVIDSGAVYIYDRYNDVYRFIPANGHLAGLCANTDDVAEPWFSPAGFNRGGFRSIVKLAFNPSKIQRDELYKVGINPVASFPGQGTVLFGDKTAQTKPSAFDRINVRRLFIVLEKAIATAAKFQLFELNDEFTRATFRNAVEPFLRDVQGRRGITDFMVVCDDTNNTGEVIDTNRFVADIYIKPARSINFITLNFIATRTGVDFSEVAGLSNA